MMANVLVKTIRFHHQAGTDHQEGDQYEVAEEFLENLIANRMVDRVEVTPPIVAPPSETPTPLPK
jgi:hypothetical protein